jgi:hypothetical protein
MKEIQVIVHFTNLYLGNFRFKISTLVTLNTEDDFLLKSVWKGLVEENLCIGFYFYPLILLLFIINCKTLPNATIEKFGLNPGDLLRTSIINFDFSCSSNRTIASSIQ